MERIHREPELPYLRSFYEVARHGGFSRAQRATGLGQPTLSKAVAALERQLGLKLFERQARGVALTSAGSEAFAQCQRIFEAVDAITSFSNRARVELRGDWFIATSEHVATYLLAPVMARMRREHPFLTPRLLTGPIHLMLEQVLDGRCELGLFFLEQPTPRVDRQALARVACQLVVAAGRGSEGRVVESFIGSRELDDPGNEKFPTVEMLKRRRKATRITISTNSLEAHKALVKEGCGVSILPLFMVEAELRSGQLEVLHPNYRFLATLEVVTRRGRALSKASQGFLVHFKAELARRGLR